MSRNSREVFLPSGWGLTLTRIGRFSGGHSPNLFRLSGDVVYIHQLELCGSGKLAGLFAFYGSFYSLSSNDFIVCLMDNLICSSKIL